MLVTVLVAATIGAIPLVLLVTRGKSYPDRWDPRVADLVDFVEQARGLEFDHPVPVDFLTAEEYSAQTRGAGSELTAEQEATLEQTSGFLRAVGLASGDVDLAQSADDLADSGTLAFYDPESKHVVVRGTELTVNLRVTLVHELTHVLQDQHFDLQQAFEDAGGSAEDLVARSEAYTALVEGDAVRIEYAYVDQLSPDELDEYTSAYDQEIADAEQDLADVPAALVASQTAPYVLGEPLVELVAADGGNAAVDAAFGDPPATAEHMFDPRTYLDRQEPTSLDEPALPDGVDEESDSGQFGAVDLYLVLAERIDPFVALDAADGWGNGRFVSYESAGRTCVRIAVDGDTDADDLQLRQAFDSWASATPSEAGAAVSDFGAGHTMVESCDPGTTVDASNERALDVLTVPAVRSQIALSGIDAGVSVDEAWAGGDCFVRHLTLDQLVAGNQSSDIPPDLQSAVDDAFAACGI